MLTSRFGEAIKQRERIVSRMKQSEFCKNGMGRDFFFGGIVYSSTSSHTISVALMFVQALDRV